jgi:hypothetical protein
MVLTTALHQNAAHKVNFGAVGDSAPICELSTSNLSHLRDEPSISCSIESDVLAFPYSANGEALRRGYLNGCGR